MRDGYRPYEFGEVPLGAWVRFPGGVADCIILASRETKRGLEIKNSYDNEWKKAQFYLDLEVSIDGGKTWDVGGTYDNWDDPYGSPWDLDDWTDSTDEPEATDKQDT